MPFQKGGKWNGNKNGRPRHKTFRDYFGEKEIDELVKIVKRDYKKRPEILKLVVEQVFGKPAQNVNLGGQGDNPNPIPLLANVYHHNSIEKDSKDGQENQGGAGRDRSEQDHQHNSDTD